MASFFNMKLLLALTLLALGYQTASATSLLETFGSGANEFTMDFVTIGNPGNAADTTGSPNPVGSVAYSYNIGKYEVSRGMIDKANAAGSLGIQYDSFWSNRANQPATAITWYEAAKYVNWLNTSTGSTAAYNFDGSGTFQLWSAGDAGYDANNLFRNSLAKYWLPSRNEWYKAAYGNLNGTWNNYATGSDTPPTAVASGTAENTAVYRYLHVADITSAGGLSPYGTMAQGGNVSEWVETAYDGINDTAGEVREYRGGSAYYDYMSDYLSSGERVGDQPGRELYYFGFRVASVPEPSALSLLAIGLGGLAILRRRK